MNRKDWQSRRPVYRRTGVYIHYTISGETFSHESIERIGGLYINDAHSSKLKVHFTVYFKSGAKFKVEKEFDKEYETKTVKGWFGDREIKTAKDLNWYFDNNEIAVKYEARRDALKESWAQHLRRQEVKGL